MEVAALVIAAITLIFALFIHSETRETLSRMNAITDTLRGAYDVKRVIRDIETTKTRRAQVICTEPKNTYINWAPTSAEPLSSKERFWMCIRRMANWLSGDSYKSVVEAEETKKKWEITSGNIADGQADKLLSEGWEPFSITSDDKIWLRRGVFVKPEKVSC